MALANGAYLEIVAERFLSDELDRSYEELATLAGPTRGELDLPNFWTTSLAASGVEPAINVRVNYFPATDGSVVVQVVATDSHWGSRGVMKEGKVSQ